MKLLVFVALLASAYAAPGGIVESGWGGAPAWGAAPAWGGAPAWGEKPAWGGEPAWGGAPAWGGEPAWGGAPSWGGAEAAPWNPWGGSSHVVAAPVIHAAPVVHAAPVAIAKPAATSYASFQQVVSHAAPVVKYGHPIAVAQPVIKYAQPVTYAVQQPVVHKVVSVPQYASYGHGGYAPGYGHGW